MKKESLPPMPMDVDRIARGYSAYMTDAEIALMLMLTAKCWAAAHRGTQVVVDEGELAAMCPLDRHTGAGWLRVLQSSFWYFRERRTLVSPYVQEVIGRPQARRPISRTIKDGAWDAARRCDDPEDFHACHFCESPITPATCHFDHLTPVSRGGMNHWANVVATCPACNLAKGARTESEFRAFMAEVAES